MNKPLAVAISSAIFTSLVFALPPAQANTSSDLAMEEITITGIRDNRKSRGATGLDLDLFETPQSLTVIGSETIDNFSIEDINTLLKMVTGVNVDASETDRTYYNARGFDITSMHIDGIGMPFGSLVVGDIDTAIYEKVEIIRGSNGLVTGLGNPSGTINYVRKRPTNDRSASANLTAGSWHNRRAEFDVSMPITKSGTWAARVVGARQTKDSWLDHYSNERNVGYAVLDGQVTSNLTITAGYSHQNNKSDGVLWGAVPVIYNDGTQADHDVTTSTTMDWTYWNTKTNEAFAELRWQINNSWNLTSSARNTSYVENSEIFYVYWNEGVGLNPETGLGMHSYPGKYDVETNNLMLDTSLNGVFTAWGQDHELQFGIASAKSDSESFAYSTTTGFVEMPAFPGWQGNEVTRPEWEAPYKSAHEDINLNRLYGSLLLSVTDSFNAVLGLNIVDYNNDGESYGIPTDSNEDGVSPYIGLTWEVTDQLNIYASYSDIYQPQYVLNENLEAIGSAEGKSYEIGVKKSLNDDGLISLAVFKTEQSNLQEFKEYGDGDGVDDTDYSDDFDYSIYREINVESEGVELEIMGNITNTLTLHAGFTHLKMEDPRGNEVRTFIPRNTLKSLLTWKPTTIENLKLGLSTRWQDDIYYNSKYGHISQNSYLLIGGFVSYDINENVSIGLNIENASNEKYFSSVKYEQAFYAAPRNINLTANWRL